MYFKIYLIPVMQSWIFIIITQVFFLFQDSLMNKTTVFIWNVFTVTSKQFNVSLLNKIVNLFYGSYCVTNKKIMDLIRKS